MAKSDKGRALNVSIVGYFRSRDLILNQKKEAALQFYKGLSIYYEIRDWGIADIVTTATTGGGPLLLAVAISRGIFKGACFWYHDDSFYVRRGSIISQIPTG